MRIVAPSSGRRPAAGRPAHPGSPSRPHAIWPNRQCRASGYTWRNVQIVGGGFVDGIVFSPSEPGLAYARTDIGGAYRWDPAAQRWVPLMDFTGFDDWNELGVESIAADPIDPDKVWVAAGEYTEPWAVPLDGEILRSDNQGRRWQVTDLPIQLGSNQDGRNMGERLAVDPDDDNILYLASPANGLWRSTDGGVTWAQVASFPVTSTPDDIGLSFVTFDPAGGHRGQPTKTIFVGDATGTDLYESTDAGASWQLVPGQPTGMMPQHGVLAANGTLLRRLRQPARAERDDRRQRVEVRHLHRRVDQHHPGGAGRGRQPGLRLRRPGRRPGAPGHGHGGHQRPVVARSTPSTGPPTAGRPGQTSARTPRWTSPPRRSWPGAPRPSSAGGSRRSRSTRSTRTTCCSAPAPPCSAPTTSPPPITASPRPGPRRRPRASRRPRSTTWSRRPPGPCKLRQRGRRPGRVLPHER